MRHHHKPCYKGHGITSYTTLTHTLPTNHEVPMHSINMSFSLHDQPSIISHAKLITNSLVHTHNIYGTCISTPLYVINHLTSQPTTNNIHETKNNKNPSYVSLKIGTLAQARLQIAGSANYASSRLGEPLSPE